MAGQTDIHPESDATVDIDIVRSLALVGARIAGGRELSETFQAIVDGVVDVLGFGAAALNRRLPNGDYSIAAVAGPDDARDALLGVEFSEAEFEEALAHSVTWGPLIYVPPGTVGHHEFTWTDATLPVGASLSADDWDPDAALIAPVRDEHGRLVAALSVDVPPNGRTPSEQLRELLAIFALQAGVAITAASTRQLEDDERNRRESRLERLARRDPLTGLPHRGALETELEASIEKAIVTGRDGAVLFCDVDRLKRVNDRHGHAAGDEILCSSATILRGTVRASDVVIRYGGDEFVVVADDISPSSAAALADRIRKLQLEPSGAGSPVGFSVGVATIRANSTTDDLLKRADAAMYSDKHARHKPSAH